MTPDSIIILFPLGFWGRMGAWKVPFRLPAPPIVGWEHDKVGTMSGV